MLILFCIILVIFWYINENFINGRQLPPGPLRVPILGTWSAVLSSLKKNQDVPYIAFQKLCQKYGSIVSIKGGTVWQIIVDDPEVMKEVLNGDDWVDRGENAFILERSFGRPIGILFGKGEPWKELRRFSIRTLREFGFGKQKSQEGMMKEELKELLGNLNESISTGDNVVNMNQFFTVSVLNILWSMVAGSRFSHKDVKLQKLVGNMSELMTTISAGGNLMMAYPFLRHIFSLFPGAGRTRIEVVGKLQKESQDILNERRQLGYYKAEQRDFIDVFLNEIHKNDSAPHPVYNDQQFISTMFDLFIAGSETTSNTCEFGILYMILNPKVQEKVQEEIDGVVGRSRFPTVADRPQMPYTEATLHEIQRMANVVPMIIRSSPHNTTLRGYKITKDMFVVLNIYSAHMNPTIWKNPEVFQPERFLDSNNKIVNNEKLFAFGIGKRVCIGELLARATLFTYFTTMLQNYTFEVAPSHPTPSVANPRFGITMAPEPYVALIKSRSY